jgi:hypothetical protein
MALNERIIGPKTGRTEQLLLGEEVQFTHRRGADEQRVPVRAMVRGHDETAFRRHMVASSDLPAAQGTHEAPEQEAGRTMMQAHAFSKCSGPADSGCPKG